MLISNQTGESKLIVSFSARLHIVIDVVALELVVGIEVNNILRNMDNVLL